MAFRSDRCSALQENPWLRWHNAQPFPPTWCHKAGGPCRQNRNNALATARPWPSDRIDVLRFKKTRGSDGITRNRFRRLGAIRQAGRVAKIEIMRWQLLGHGLQHGEAADPRIENANAR